MKKHGIVHPELARVLAELGHGDQICIADVGLPVPPGVPRIDLAYRLGAPGFLDVVAAIADEIVVEQLMIADEALARSPEVVAGLQQVFGEVRLVTTTHEQFKIATRRARVIIRTGETTPYANVLLTSGVPFG